MFGVSETDFCALVDCDVHAWIGLVYVTILFDSQPFSLTTP